MNIQKDELCLFRYQMKGFIKKNRKNSNEYLIQIVYFWYLTIWLIKYIIYLTRQSEGECTSPDPASLFKL